MSDVIDFPPQLRIVQPPAPLTSAPDRAHAIALRIESLAHTLRPLCGNAQQRYAAEVIARVAAGIARQLDTPPPGGDAA